MARELRGSMVSPLVTGRVHVSGYQKLAQDSEGSEEPGGAHESDAERHSEKSQAGSVVLENDLKAAIEVKFSGEVSVLYPHVHHRFHIFDTTSEMVMQVSLRDDASISGTCLVSIASSSLRASESFGSFGIEVAEFLQKEQLEVDRERELRQERKESLDHEIEEERRAWGDSLLLAWTFCGLLFSGLLVLCVSVEPQDWASALMLSLVVTLLFCCMFGFCQTIEQSVQFFASHFATGHARFLGRFGPLAWNFLGCLCLAAAAVRYIRAGFWWSALMPGVADFWCFFLLCFRFVWTSGYNFPITTVTIKAKAAERTIVFHGSVLEGGGPCVASWPGKYESAWDSLVQGSRKGHVSAAVVFLPEGSEHFGHHDPIPLAEGLEGSCWCVPLYGEEKPWGCRWWTKWKENIEEAVAKGAELEVYYFKGMVGKGKVSHFLTAGKEHLRRDAISAQKEDFMKSQGFLALKDDLEHLQKDPRGDSTSQYSREVQRLFLASLSEEDRSFMEASEGLGNSQKAEVAWLEKKRYAYTEVDVSFWRHDS